MASFLDSILGSSGIPSSPTSQLISTSSISPWAQPYISSYLQRAQNLSTQGPNPAQQQVYDASQNMQTPGQFAYGTNLLNQSGQGLLGTTGQALGYGALGAGYGGLAAGAGQNYQNMATNPSSIQAYMNPYIQQSLAPQLNLLNQQQALGGQEIAAKAVGQGAFGGNRATLAQGLNAQNYDLARQQAIGQGYNQAFNQAQQAQQFGANLGLQGLQAGMQGAGLGLQGVQGAQQGYQGATQAGAALGNIGAQQGQYGLGQLALQNQIANQQYQLPYQNLQFMQGMMGGLPVSSSTQQGYQAPPNYLSQLAGYGLTGLGAYGMGKDLGWWGGSGGSGTDAANNLMSQVNAGKVAADAGGTPYVPLPGMNTDLTSMVTEAKGGVIKEKKYSAGGDVNLIPTKQLVPMAQNPNLDPMEAAYIQKELMDRARIEGNPQSRQIIGGGLDTIPSGNMFKAAGGGIVAFAGNTDGSLVQDKKVPSNISNYEAWLENTIRQRMENLDKGNPFERSQALEEEYTKDMKDRQSRRGNEFLTNLGLGLLGSSPYLSENVKQGGVNAMQGLQKSAAEDAADRKLLLQQAVEQEKAKYGRDVGNLGALQTSLGQMYSKQIGKMNAGATAAATQTYRDQLLVQKYATLWKDTLDDTKDSLLKQTKFNNIYRKDPVAFNRLAEQEAKRNMPKVALDALGKTPALSDTNVSGGGATTPTLPPGFQLNQ